MIAYLSHERESLLVQLQSMLGLPDSTVVLSNVIEDHCFARAVAHLSHERKSLLVQLQSMLGLPDGMVDLGHVVNCWQFKLLILDLPDFQGLFGQPQSAPGIA